jgi:hypothetical protein
MLRQYHADFQTAFCDAPKTGEQQFQQTMELALDRLSALGTSPGAIVEGKLFLKSLGTGVAPETAASEGPSVVAADDDMDAIIESFGDDTDVDLNDAAKPQQTNPIRAEMKEFALHVAAQWSEQRPFYVRRSKANPEILLISTCIGTHKGTKSKTNVNATIGGAKNLADLGPDFLNTSSGNALVESHDHSDGRTYFVRAIKIIDGSILRIWISRYDASADSWQQIAVKRLTLNNAAKHGFLVG